MVDKVAKKVTLDLSDIPRERHVEAKQAVGEFIQEEIFRSVSQGRSPVEGGRRFKRLSEEYADRMKGGDTNPNLELTGNMLDALEIKRRRDGVEIGVFKSSQVGKADGHNNFSGKSKLPNRRFIPENNQKFVKRIEDGIQRTLQDFKGRPVDKEPTLRDTISKFGIQTTITVDDLFEDILDG